MEVEALAAQEPRQEQEAIPSFTPPLLLFRLRAAGSGSASFKTHFAYAEWYD
jgi:hypothetical protein